MAKNDSAAFLANFNGHDSIIALPGLKHRDSVILCRFLGIEHFLVDNALSSIPDDSKSHYSLVLSFAVKAGLI